MRSANRLRSALALGFSVAPTTSDVIARPSNGPSGHSPSYQMTSQLRRCSSAVSASDESQMQAEIAKDAADALADQQKLQTRHPPLQTLGDDDDDVPSITMSTNYIGVPVNLCSQFDSRLKTLVNGLSPEQIGEMPATDAVLLASQYVMMHDIAHTFIRRSFPFKNLVTLHPLQEAALFGAAFRAIEEDKVPIDIAVRILRPHYQGDRFASYRSRAIPLVRGKIIEEILKGTLTPLLSRKVMLSAGKNLGKDARIIGNLAKKALGDDITTLYPDAVIRLMFVISETTVKPPSELWSHCLRYIVSTMRKPRGEVLDRLNEGKSKTESTDGTRESKIEGKDNDAKSETYDEYTEGEDDATAAHPRSQSQGMDDVMAPNEKRAPVGEVDKAERDALPFGLHPRQCYRLLHICSKTGVYTDINMLAQVVEEAWKNIAINAAKCKFGEISAESEPMTSRVAIHRLKRVSGLSPYDFFCLIQFSASLGTNFNAGQGVITDGVLVPLIPFLTDQNLLELMGTLSISKNRYPPVYQAIIDRLVQTNKYHPHNPVLILHTQKLLRLLSRQDELCGQIRLASFFNLLEEVCNHKKVLRTVQMARIVEDIYFISRRFARSAPIVIRLRVIVDNFAEVIVKHLDMGLVSVDQVNRMLEIAVMMGMKSPKVITNAKGEGNNCVNSSEYKNLETLRERRKELYKDVEPGQFPTSYRHRVSQMSRILFQEMVHINQRTMIFNLPVEKHRLASLFEYMVLSGPLNVIIACNLYRTVYGTHLPMCPVLTKMLTTFLSQAFRNVKVGASINLVSGALGTRNQRLANADDILALVHCAKKDTIPGISGHKFYVDYLEAAATVVNVDRILEQISPLKAHAL